MRKKRHSYSIRRKLIVALIAIFLPMNILMFFMSNYTKNKLRDEVALSNKSIIDVQIKNVDGWIKQDEIFLLNLFHTDMNVQYLKKNQSSENRPNYIYNIQQKFENHQLEGNSCELYFLLFEDDRYSLFTLEGNYTSSEKLAIEDYLNNQELTTDLSSVNWEAIEINGEYYYVRELCKNGFCLGGLIKVNTVLSMMGLNEDQNVAMSIVSQNGEALSKNDWIKDNQIDLMNDQEPDRIYYMTGKDDRYLVIRSDFSVIKGRFAYIMEDKSVLGDLSILTDLMNIILIITIVMLLALFIIIHRTVITPLAYLKSIIEQIKDGNMDTKIEYASASREFTDVYDLFNEMMEKIQYFKILSYEEEIEKKNFQLQYYLIQLKPHFYLNSLKCLYAMAQNKDYGTIQKMILNLSDYFKYITYDSQSLIPLEEELRHTNTYISIRQQGVMNQLECVLSIDNRARQLPVLGLSVQTFIENSIKYAMVEDKKLIIEVKVSIMEQGNITYMDIMVTDNGNGYSQNIIKAINSDHTEDMKGHIGLINLKNRLKLIYGKEAYMTISNLPTGGAYSEILFPVRRREKDESIGS